MDIEKTRIVILAADGYEDQELSEPLDYFVERGAQVMVAGLEPGTATGKRGEHRVEVDAPVADLDPDDFDVLIIPGGKAPEKLRMNDDVLRFTRQFFREDKLVGAICHAGQVLISADLVEGRRVTSWPGIRDDLIAAGATWEDREVTVDEHLVTSRKPDDLPAFNRTLFESITGGEATPARELRSAEERTRI